MRPQRPIFLREKTVGPLLRGEWRRGHNHGAECAEFWSLENRRHTGDDDCYRFLGE